MPYSSGLQQYLPAEVFAEPPEQWERRLREVSPITDRMEHLRFRFRAGKPSMLHPDAQRRGVWELYACTPRALVPREDAVCFVRHWSEMPKDQQVGRRAIVSSYQHYMWHVHGVYARRHWVLQGEAGGTPAAYSRLEERLLDAEGWLSDPLPIGALPPCPFNELTVAAILERDLYWKAGGDVDEMSRRGTSDMLKSQWEDAERQFRKKWLGWWHRQMAPQAEYMKSYLGTVEADNTLRRATKAEANACDVWREQFVDTGVVPMAGIASSTAVQVPALGK